MDPEDGWVDELKVVQSDQSDISMGQGASQAVKLFAIALAKRRKGRLRNLLPHSFSITLLHGATNLDHRTRYLSKDVHLVVGHTRDLVKVVNLH